MLDQLQEATRRCQPAQALGIVLERTRYRAWLESQKDGPAKLLHLEELQSVMESSPAPDLATWLIDMHLGEVDGPAFGGKQASSSAPSMVQREGNGRWSSSSVVKKVFCPMSARQLSAGPPPQKTKRGGWRTWRFPARRCSCTWCTARRVDFQRRPG